MRSQRIPDFVSCHGKKPTSYDPEKDNGYRQPLSATQMMEGEIEYMFEEHSASQLRDW